MSVSFHLVSLYSLYVKPMCYKGNMTVFLKIPVFYLVIRFPQVVNRFKEEVIYIP